MNTSVSGCILHCKFNFQSIVWSYEIQEHETIIEILWKKIGKTALPIIQLLYIASAETKPDWLIRGHVTLDKCSVSLEQ